MGQKGKGGVSLNITFLGDTDVSRSLFLAVEASLNAISILNQRGDYL